MSFRPLAKRSGGIHPSCNNNLRKVKSATWEDSSTPFHDRRNDMSIGGSTHPHRLYSERGGRQIAAPTGVVPFIHTVYIRYLSRNGTQAVPYGFAGGWYHSTARVVFGTLHGDELSPLHCVVPFECAGSTKNRPAPDFGSGPVIVYVYRSLYRSARYTPSDRSFSKLSVTAALSAA